MIVVGASAGGVAALKELVSNLRSDFECFILIVLHISSYTQSRLPEILSKAGPLEAKHAQDGESIERGKIYIAPGDHHLILDEKNRKRWQVITFFQSSPD